MAHPTIRFATILVCVVVAPQTTPVNAQVLVQSPAHKPNLFLFNIPAMPLQQALERFSAVSGSAVMYSSSLADGRRSLPVIGLYTAEVGLRLLLQGTDLTIRYTSPTDFLLIEHAAKETDAKAEEGSAEGASATLTLGTLYVDLPPGSARKPDYTAYGQTVRGEVKRALARDVGTAHRVYQIQMDVWISKSGKLKFPSIVRSTAIRQVDEEVLRIIGQTSISTGPPDGMPQPLRLTMIAF